MRTWCGVTDFPLPESIRVAGLACFYNEKVDLYVDGALQERPKTMFLRDRPGVPPVVHPLGDSASLIAHDKLGTVTKRRRGERWR